MSSLRASAARRYSELVFAPELFGVCVSASAVSIPADHKDTDPNHDCDGDDHPAQVMSKAYVFIALRVHESSRIMALLMLIEYFAP